MQLRPYQQDSKDAVTREWQLKPLANVLLVKPTGAGKTVTMASIIHSHIGASCAIAHRQELVGQISQALAREGIIHRIIAPANVIKVIVKEHTNELGRSFYDPTANCAVAGVDTLLRRNGTGFDGDYYVHHRDDELHLYGPRRNGLWPYVGQISEDLTPEGALKGKNPPQTPDTNIINWFRSVTLWVTDEAHHLLVENKWGKAASLFPNAKGLGVTATPLRADGKGLGSHADGVFDCMIEGPSMRWLIDNKYLTDYRIFAPPSDLVVDGSPGSTGDWSQPQLKAASKKSHIVGDVVEHYQRIAPGKRGVVFSTDIETATDIANNFKAQGVAAEVISSKNSDKERARIINDFKNGKLTVLVNVDLFGEGFDLPAISVAVFARPTMSYALYVQQFGRALRIMEGKTEAVIIDHVGNVQRHGLPDAPRVWSLDRRDRGSRGSHDPDKIPTKICQVCTAEYVATHDNCPYCGHYNEPACRSKPEQVDGDLTELDPAVLAEMRGEIAKVDKPSSAIFNGLKQSFGNGIAKKQASIHEDRQAAQKVLRETMAMWAGHQLQLGRNKREQQKRFYWRYNVDVATAQTLNKKDADELTGKIVNDLLTNQTGRS